MEHKTDHSSRCIGSVKVGLKGQIVIPKEVRDMFGIAPGDTLLVLADSSKGIAIERYETLSKIADAILSGHAKEIYPDHDAADSERFAEAIKELGKEAENDAESADGDTHL